MSNVVSMERTCSYWVSRARKHRIAGRYDEAMALLSKAADQFGLNEEAEWEQARVYEEIGCDEEAARSYLRVMRMNGVHKAEALFQLTLSSAQHADLRRAISYFEQFSQMGSSNVSQELASALGEQLRQEVERPVAETCKARSKDLERRAVERLQGGRVYAARRTLLHAMDLRSTPQRLTLLACCDLLLNRLKDAVMAAQEAHKLAPARVQTICVLTDALYATEHPEEARRMLHIGVLRAKSSDDYLSVAMESAKHGEDALTLAVTKSLLHREPFCTRAMMLRSCALINLGQMKEASRLLGRLCGLLPENTVCQALYRMARDGKQPSERLTLGMDVPRQEAMERAVKLVSALYEDPEVLLKDSEKQKELCRLSAWAFHSTLAGPNTSIIAMILMGGLNTERSRGVLLDTLTDPQIPDNFKYAILQTLTEKDGFAPYDVDMDGQLVRLAAGGEVQGQPGSETGQDIVQMAADSLLPDFPNAAQVLLPLFIGYLNDYGVPRGRQKAACAAALEKAFHKLSGRSVDLNMIAARYNVSPRLCRMLTKRLLAVAKRSKKEEETYGID